MLGSGTGGWSNMYVEKFASGVRVRKYFEIKYILQIFPTNLGESIMDSYIHELYFI